jgi:hypothetical protein
MSEQRETKNSVFTGNTPPAHDPRIQAMTSADKLKAEFGLDTLKFLCVLFHSLKVGLLPPFKTPYGTSFSTCL